MNKQVVDIGDLVKIKRYLFDHIDFSSDGYNDNLYVEDLGSYHVEEKKAYIRNVRFSWIIDACDKNSNHFKTMHQFLNDVGIVIEKRKTTWEQLVKHADFIDLSKRGKTAKKDKLEIYTILWSSTQDIKNYPFFLLEKV